MYACASASVLVSVVKQWGHYQTLPPACEEIRGEFRPEISMLPGGAVGLHCEESFLLTYFQQINVTDFHSVHPVVHLSENHHLYGYFLKVL